MTTPKSAKPTPNKVRALAESYISSGKYHCAESVLLALGETIGFPVDLKYVTGFGRGLGGTKCVCGAYSGSVVVLNLLYGADKRNLAPSLLAATNLKLEKAIQQFDERWKLQNKYTCCRLLTKDVVWGSPEHTKHCVKLTGDAAEILYNLITETDKAQTKPQPAYRIKPAQQKDQKTIRNLLSSYKLPLEGLENTKLWVLKSSKGDLLGIAGLETYGDQGLLRSVAVKQDQQHQGYGSLIVNHVLAEAKKRQIKDLFLLTTTAPDFFRKLGFKVENREKVAGAILDSVEFKTACPKTAVLMQLR